MSYFYLSGYLRTQGVLLSCAVSFLTLIAQQGPSKSPSSRELKGRISALIDQPKFAAMRWGLLIMTVNGQVLFERDADKALIPASNMKLFTTAAALDRLGPETTFRTSVYASRPVHSGILTGDLILYGRGDPNLSSRFEAENMYSLDALFVRSDKVPAIERLADQIKARGIKVITGNLVGDDSFFATKLLPSGWEWEDTQSYYGAEVSALSVNDNSISYTVTPSQPGKAPMISMQPQTSYAILINNACTSENGQSTLGFNRPLRSNAIEFYGSIPSGAKEYKITVPVHDPALFAATLLHEALARRGIRVAGMVCRMDAISRCVTPFDPTKMTEIAYLTSQPLFKMIKVVNKLSQNLHAEILLRHLGIGCGEQRDDRGRPKAIEACGNEVRKSFIEGAGIDVKALNLRDGSGLSRHNLLTPRATVRLLQVMLSHPYGATFRDSLPLAGVDGTLEQRMRGTAAANTVLAKTGGLGQVSALSGYVTTKRGQPLIVSFMANNYTGPMGEIMAVFDEICVLLAES